MQMILDDQYSNWFYLDVMTLRQVPCLYGTVF